MVCQHFQFLSVQLISVRVSCSRAPLTNSWPLNMDTDVSMLFMYDNERYNTTPVTNYHTGTTWWTTIRKSLSASKWLEPILDPEFIIWDRSEFSQECHVSEFLWFSKTKYSGLTPLLQASKTFQWFDLVNSVTPDLSIYQIRIGGLFLPLPNKTNGIFICLNKSFEFYVESYFLFGSFVKLSIEKSIG